MKNLEEQSLEDESGNNPEVPSSLTEKIKSHQEEISDQEASQLIKSAQEKINFLYEMEDFDTPTYAALSEVLMRQEGNQNVWKSTEEIDVPMLKKKLEEIGEEERIASRKEWEEGEGKKDKIRALERELGNAGSKFEKLDGSLFLEKGEKEKFIQQQKDLPPEAMIYLYHGLNDGGYDGALDILNSSSKGLEQRSGPALSMVPAGQFWKGVGFRYEIRRDQINFPGENNPNAVIHLSGDENMEGIGYIENESRSLPLDQFKADVIRSKFADADPENEKLVIERLNQFSEIREKKDEE